MGICNSIIGVVLFCLTNILHLATAFELCPPPLQAAAAISRRTIRRHRRHSNHETLQFAQRTCLRMTQDISSDVKDSSSLRGLYPATELLRNGTLRVDELHTLYYQEYGQRRLDTETSNAEDSRLVALFLHGGPGAGCFPNHARFFDPELYRVVLLDQRGSGKSTPRGEIRHNTLLHLVHDCERLRLHLLGNRQKSKANDDRRPAAPAWDVVLGGSWGTTLAIAYAQEYPNSVKSLVLRGVCLLRPREVDWLFSADGGAAKNVNPAGWKEFAKAVLPSSSLGPPPDDKEMMVVGGSSISAPQQQYQSTIQQLQVQHHRDVLHAYYDRLLSGVPFVRLQAARRWMQWEFSVFGNSSSSSSSTNSTSQNTTASSNTNAVVASYDLGQWSYQDADGNSLETAGAVLTAQSMGLDVVDGTLSCSETVQFLKQGLVDNMNESEQNLPQLSMRPLRPVEAPIVVPENATFTAEQEAFIPAQNMLTCYYSVNDRFAMNNLNLLSPTRMARIQHIPCIAVQGGQDRICPVDTALELANHWPSLRLRIPLHSGHSMYDPAITNELVRATESMAKDLLKDR